MLKRDCYRIDRAGSINNLKLVKENLPDPEENEVTVQVKVIGLNFADIFAIQGLYSATPKGSFVSGLEYSGIIIKKGKNVNESPYAEFVARSGSCVKNRYFIEVPLRSTYIISDSCVT